MSPISEFTAYALICDGCGSDFSHDWVPWFDSVEGAHEEVRLQDGLVTDGGRIFCQECKSKDG